MLRDEPRSAPVGSEVWKGELEKCSSSATSSVFLGVKYSLTLEVL